MHWNRVILVLAVIADGLRCNGHPTTLAAADSEGGEQWVLFIGSSHTSANRLPQMVESLAQLSGTTPLRTDVVAFGNYALEDHWFQGDAARALKRRQWDFVVLQQGPSSLPESQGHLAFWSMKFAPMIRQAGAEPVLYQIWPAAARRGDAANALRSYRNAADSVDAILAPAGDAFTAAMTAYPEISPYAPDGVHASIQGSYLAALTLLARINGSDPRLLAPNIPGIEMDTTIVRRLQHAAAAALERNPARP